MFWVTPSNFSIVLWVLLFYNTIPSLIAKRCVMYSLVRLCSVVWSESNHKSARAVGICVLVFYQKLSLYFGPYFLHFSWAILRSSWSTNSLTSKFYIIKRSQKCVVIENPLVPTLLMVQLLWYLPASAGVLGSLVVTAAAYAINSCLRSLIIIN